MGRKSTATSQVRRAHNCHASVAFLDDETAPKVTYDVRMRNAPHDADLAQEELVLLQPQFMSVPKIYKVLAAKTAILALSGCDLNTTIHYGKRSCKHFLLDRLDSICTCASGHTSDRLSTSKSISSGLITPAALPGPSLPLAVPPCVDFSCSSCTAAELSIRRNTAGSDTCWPCRGDATLSSCTQPAILADRPCRLTGATHARARSNV
jgi:hypothetical protein